MSESAFARRMLEKQGWKEGDGLGKKKDGISKPIKVNLKMDKTGVGHNPGEDFTDHWWLRAFNDAANSITKCNTDQIPEAEEKPLPQNKLYQGFRKGTVLNRGQEQKGSDCSSDDDNEQVDASELPTLDDIHKFCGGATGHRAATLGIKMGGKRHRAAEQERLFNEKLKHNEAKDDKNMSEQPYEDGQTLVVKIEKKKKKHLEKESHINVYPTTENSSSHNVNKNNLEQKRKKKYSEKEAQIEIVSAKQNNSSHDVNKNGLEQKGKKKKHSENEAQIEIVPNIENSSSHNVDENNLEQKRKKKKKLKMDNNIEIDSVIRPKDSKNESAENGLEIKMKKLKKEDESKTIHDEEHENESKLADSVHENGLGNKKRKKSKKNKMELKDEDICVIISLNEENKQETTKRKRKKEGTNETGTEGIIEIDCDSDNTKSITNGDLKFKKRKKKHKD